MKSEPGDKPLRINYRIIKPEITIKNVRREYNLFSGTCGLRLPRITPFHGKMNFAYLPEDEGMLYLF